MYAHMLHKCYTVILRINNLSELMVVSRMAKEFHVITTKSPYT